jgi:cytochrome oxidase Cu insertion factor (SCO1/SenC/PrrC family)
MFSAQRANRPAAAFVGAIAAALALAGCGGGSSTPATTPAARQSGFAGAALVHPVPAPGFELRDSEGHAASLARYRGEVAVLAFLDSSCRACELIGQQIRGALDELANPPPVLIVSVDPAVDTPLRVAGFLERVSLAGRARYLNGPAGALPAVWHAYHAVTPAHGQEAFESAATVYLLDREGRERVLYQEEQLTPEALAHDIRALQRG